MKALSYPRILLYLCAALVLASCGDDDKKKDDPAPKEYNIKIHVVGQNLQGLGADMSYTSEYDFINTGRTGPAATEAFTTAAVDKTYDLGKFGTYDIVEGYINLRNVTRTSTLRVPAGSFLKMEILVDGRVTQYIQLDNTGEHQNANYSPHFRGYVAQETDNL